MSFWTLFEPERVAVIGVLRNEAEVGCAVLKNVIDTGFSGRIYPVNHKADDMLDLKCHPTVGNIPEPSVHNMNKVERAATMLKWTVDFDRIYTVRLISNRNKPVLSYSTGRREDKYHKETRL